MREELSVFLYNRLLEAYRQPKQHAVRELRLILESVFGELTKNEGRYFDSLYARMQYVFDKQAVPSALRRSIEQARRCLSGRYAIEEETFLICFRVLVDTIEHFSGTPVPEELRLWLTNVPEFPEQQSVERQITDLHIVVKTIGPLQARHNSVMFRVEGMEEELGQVSLEVWDGGQIRHAYLHGLLSPWQTIKAIGVRQGEDGCFSVGDQSLLILEPDLLLDISDLAECFDDTRYAALLFVVKKLVPQETSLAMFSGSMVNALFDVAVRKENPDLKETYRAAVGEQGFQAAVFGREKLLTIYDEIRYHHWRNIEPQAIALRKRSIRIEPSFMSDTFGLQGRLDCLMEDPDQPMVKDILELKGGKPPTVGSRTAHRMQVTGYNLLLRSAFGPERKGTSVIFYSKAVEDPLRNVTNDHEAEHQLLSLRNEVVHYLLRLAQNDETVFEEITEKAGAGLPSFQLAHFRSFFQAWQHAGPDVRDYYRLYIGFLCREYLSARTGAYSAVEREDNNDGFAALWRRSEEEKKASFSILTDLEIAEIAENGMRIRLNRKPAEHSFRQGDLILFYPKSGNELRPMEQQFVKARIEEIRQEQVVISLNHGQISRTYFDSHPLWAMEADLYDKSYWANAADLFKMLTADSPKRALYLGYREPKAPLVPVEHPDIAEKIIKQAIQAEDYFLIQGPPGTGKTSRVLTEIVNRICSSGTSAVVVAFTNRAVDEIALQLERREIPFLKLGSKGSGAEDKLKAFCQQGDLEGARQHIIGHQVFLGTVASMSSRIDQLMKIKNELQTLIVDEASQLTEPQIVGMISRFKKFILIGDQNQLPPVVTQDKQFTIVEKKALNAIGLNDLRSSLFERLINLARKNGWHHAYGMLEKHYRMHKEIARLVNPWYGHQLLTGQDRQLEALRPLHVEGADAWNVLFNQSRCLFIPSTYDPSFKTNRDEVEKVVAMLTYLKKALGPSFNPREDVGVITPWRTQIAGIREGLAQDDLLQDVQVDTIERYQGSEKKIIIVSMAVAHSGQLDMMHSPTFFEYNVNGQTKIVSVERKLLVTLSRAKERIILLGYKPALLSQKAFVQALSGFYEAVPVLSMGEEAEKGETDVFR